MHGIDVVQAFLSCEEEGQQQQLNITAHPQSSQSMTTNDASMSSLQIKFEDMDEDAALEELARAAEELYDADPTHETHYAPLQNAFLQSEQQLGWQLQLISQHQQHQVSSPAQAQILPAVAASSSGSAAGPLTGAAANALLPLIQSRVPVQTPVTTGANVRPAYVPPHAQYLLNRTAQPSSHIIAPSTTATTTTTTTTAPLAPSAATAPLDPSAATAAAAVTGPGIMHPTLVGAGEMNTLHSKISSANTAQHEQRRHHRLARNRASARLRRKKKKTVVETLEADAKSLEQQLHCLREHNFNERLTEDVIAALEVDTASYMHAPEMLQSAWQTNLDLLQRTYQNVLADTDLLATVHTAAAQQGSEAGDADTNLSETQELLRLLQLRPEQVEEIRTSNLADPHARTQRLQTDLARIERTNCKRIHLQSLTEELKACLNDNQITKWSSWLELNRETVEDLDPLKERDDNWEAQLDQVAYIFDFFDRTVKPASKASA